jgi:hypothetical protein
LVAARGGDLVCYAMYDVGRFSKFLVPAVTLQCSGEAIAKLCYRLWCV